jgi:hypothetical protein
VGEYLYRINRLAPGGLAIASLASYAEVAGQLPDAHRYELGFALAAVIAEGVKDQPFFEGMSNTVRAIQNPVSAPKKWVERFVPTLIPLSGLLHQVKRAGIPGVMEGDRARRVVQGLTWWEQLKNNMVAELPNWSKSLPPQRNEITYEPVEAPPGWGWGIGLGLLMPVQVTALNNDPVFVAIAENKPSLREYPRALKGRPPTGIEMTREAVERQGVPIDAWERDRGIQIMAKEVKIRGRNLHQALTDEVTSPRFLELTKGKGGGRANRIHEVYSQYLDEAVERHTLENERIKRATEELGRKIEQRKSGRHTGPEVPYEIAPGMTLPGTRR